MLIFSFYRQCTANTERKLIVRILLIVPVYSLVSWFSLLSLSPILGISLLRDCYEGKTTLPANVTFD